MRGVMLRGMSLSSIHNAHQFTFRSAKTGKKETGRWG